MLVVCFFLSFWGCETKYYAVTITNESSKQVTYTYNDSIDTLESKKSKAYQVVAYTQPPRDISVLGTMSVKMERFGVEYVFIDVTPLDLHVLNTLNVDIELEADKYIDTGLESTSLTIAAKSETTTAKIYTTKPQFIIKSNYSPIIEWSIDNAIMYVTIK